MVVRQDHCRARRPDRPAKHLARVDQAGVEQPTRDLLRITCQAALGIDMQYPENLSLKPAHRLTQDPGRVQEMFWRY